MITRNGFPVAGGEDTVLARLSVRAGERVLERWDLGPDLLEVVRHFDDADAPPSPASGCRELVQLAARQVDPPVDEGARERHRRGQR